jgi:L-serine/L-threonine ammonia-lyase
MIHVRTPLVESAELTRILGTRVLLKLEALQPCASFKIRGLGLHCQRLRDRGVTQFVSSSGGNAGLAVAYAGRRLGAAVTVFVPESTPPMMLERIRAEGAHIEVRGRIWDEAHLAALEFAAASGAGYVHPFDGADIWEGHASMIDEIEEAPGAVVLSVGGGGLLCGVALGLHRRGWTDVPILAAETAGAASLAAAVAAGKVVTLDRIDTLATTLGARTVAAEAFAWTRRHPVVPWTVSDRSAVGACWQFARDHRLLVEPACGAALSAVYERAQSLHGRSPVLVVVCGGAGVDVELLSRWRTQVGLC